MTLRASISDDATTVFLAEDDFAESVTYLPYRDPGAAARSNRVLSAVVIRNQIENISEDDGATVSPQWEVHVHNDSTTGIAGTELNLGRDQITFPPRDGQAAATRTITQLITQDHGMLVLECL